MPNFKYKVMNQNGERLEGVYTANSKEDVMSMIRTNNYYPLKIEEIVESTKIEFDFLSKVKTKDIAIFCRQFYTMLNAGATISRCLNVLGQQSPNKTLRKSIIGIDESVKKGLTLSKAMKKEEGIFPDLLVNMVETGEVSGNLDLILQRMANHYEKENKLNNKIKSAMIYPIVLGVLCIAIVTFILVFVMPTFVGMFQSSGVELPMPTKILLSMSNTIRTRWPIILLVILASVFGLNYYFKTESGQLFSSKIKLKIPIVKGMNEKIIVTRFTRTLATVLSSGITLIEGLQIVSKIVGNRVVEHKLLAVKDKLIKGVGLSEPLKETGVFPPMLYSMVKIGEESGSLDDILDKTADFYDEELDAVVQQFTAILEPAMILVMGVIVSFIVMSIALPMFDMANTVK